MSETAIKVKFGVYDSKDNCWLGDEKGPKLFDDPVLAQIAAQVYATQVFGSDLSGRYVKKEFPQDESFHHKDDVPTQHTTLTALRRLENSASEDEKQVIEIDMKNLRKSPASEEY